MKIILTFNRSRKFSRNINLEGDEKNFLAWLKKNDIFLVKEDLQDLDFTTKLEIPFNNKKAYKKAVISFRGCFC